MAYATHAVGSVLKNGTCTCLARVTTVAGVNLTQAAVSSISRTVYLLDASNPDTRTAVTNHSAVTIAVATTIYDTLQTGGAWTVDSTGYNFADTIDVSTNAAFGTAGRDYLVEYTITPASGQVIKIGFRVHVI